LEKFFLEIFTEDTGFYSERKGFLFHARMFGRCVSNKLPFTLKNPGHFFVRGSIP